MTSEGGTASLIIRDVQPGDAGLIECVAKNAKVPFAFWDSAKTTLFVDLQNNEF